MIFDVSKIGIRPTLVKFGNKEKLIFHLISNENQIGFRKWNGVYEAGAISPLLGTELEELAKQFLQDIYWIITEKEYLVLFGDTYGIKEDLKSIGFNWGGYEPVPHWKIPFSSTVSEFLNDKFNLKIPIVRKESKEIKVFEPKEIKLYKHQKQAVQDIHIHDCFGLFHEMGAGKTFPPLSYAKSTNTKIFAVVPASIRLNWYKEAEKFGMKPFIYPKLFTMKKVYKVLFNKYNNDVANDIAITSYTTFNKTVYKKKQMNIEEIDRITDQYDLFVFDESQYIKNWKAQRTKSVLKLIEFAKKKNKKVLFLSGTPLLNRPAELYTTLKALIPHLEHYVPFVEKYNGAFRNEWGLQLGVPSNLDELHNRMSKVSSRVLKKDCLDLPEKTRQDVLISDAKVIVPAYPEDVSQLLGWMQKYKMAVAEAKIKQTVELASSGIPCLVFTAFIAVNNKITESLRQIGLRVGQIYSGVSQADRNDVIDKYQNGEIDVVVGGIKSMGVGITLTRGSNVIFNDMDWTPGNMLQAEDRAHRISQKNNVTVTILVAPDEFDQMLWDMINSKFSVITQVLDGTTEQFATTSVFAEMRKHFMKKLGITETKEKI